MKKSRVLSLLAALAALPLVFLLVSGVLDTRLSRESLALAERAVRRAAVQCYALEGVYPPSLGYLVERYGVLIDSDRFFVDYQYIASNLMPDITVLPRRSSAGG